MPADESCPTASAQAPESNLQALGITPRHSLAESRPPGFWRGIRKDSRRGDGPRFTALEPDSTFTQRAWFRCRQTLHTASSSAMAPQKIVRVVIGFHQAGTVT